MRYVSKAFQSLMLCCFRYDVMNDSAGKALGQHQLAVAKLLDVLKAKLAEQADQRLVLRIRGDEHGGDGVLLTGGSPRLWVVNTRISTESPARSLPYANGRTCLYRRRLYRARSSAASRGLERRA